LLASAFRAKQDAPPRIRYPGSRSGKLAR
jgi:hypothetical protein